ncbi:hypothetical protein GCM10009624_16730 [Gordonia sinesedis]
MTARFRRLAPAVLAVSVVIVAACTVDGRPVADPAPPSTTTTTTVTYPSETMLTTEPTTSPTRPPISEVPPPPNATTMTCREYNALNDESVQVAIVKANGVTKNPALVASLMNILCLSRPDETVNAVVNSLRDEIIHN